MSSAEKIPGQGQETRILIVEDHSIFRMGLKELIDQEKDLVVCGEADNVSLASEQIMKEKPDMVIVDISLKGKNGIELIKEIRHYNNRLPVLVLSMHPESLYAERAFMAGAKGYIMKQETSESVIKAIRCVLSGRMYASDSFFEDMLAKTMKGSQGVYLSPLQNLSDRELEVFRLLGQGFTTKEIATELHLGIKTIGTYRERIKDKLNLKHASELMRHAVYYVEFQNLESPQNGQIGD